MLESELMTTMNDHIRLVNFDFDGDLQKLDPYLRLGSAVTITMLPLIVLLIVHYLSCTHSKLM
jgi:hypothetical protein